MWVPCQSHGTVSRQRARACNHTRRRRDVHKWKRVFGRRLRTFTTFLVILVLWKMRTTCIGEPIVSNGIVRTMILSARMHMQYLGGACVPGVERKMIDIR